MKYWKWTLLWLCLGSVAVARPLVIVSGDDYWPYSDSRLPQGGLAAALVKAAFAKVNQDVELVWLPWARGLSQTKHGVYAATFPYLRNDEREKDFYYSDEILSVRSTAFVKAGTKKFDFSRVETLEGSIYCLPIGWAPTPKLAPLLSAGTIKRESPPSISACAKMVVLGRADYFVYGDLQAAQALREGDVSPGALMKVDGPPLTTTPLYLIASKHVPGSAGLLDSFNKGLAMSIKDGSYAKIVKSYEP